MFLLIILFDVNFFYSSKDMMYHERKKSIVRMTLKRQNKLHEDVRKGAIVRYFLGCPGNIFEFFDQRMFQE